MKSKSKINNIGILFLCFIYTLVLFMRAAKSLGINDESNGIAGVLHILQGEKPFSGSWDYHPGWFLLAPFYSLFLRLHNGCRDGIMLFSRFLYLGVCLVIVTIIVWKYIRKTADLSFCCVFFIIAYVPFSIFQLNYNAFSVYLLLLSLCLIEIQTKDKTGPLTWFISGTVMGLVCITYPSLIFVAIIYVSYKFFEQTKVRRKHSAGFFIIGLSVTAALFLLWICIDNPPQNILQAINEIFKSPHELSKHGFDADFFITTFRNKFYHYAQNSWLIFVYSFLQLCLFLYCERKSSDKYLHLIPFSIYFLFTIYNGYFFLGRFGIWLFSFNFFLSTYIWLFFDRRIKIKSYLPYLIVELGFIITYALSSDTRNFLFGVQVCNIITAFTAVTAMVEYLRNQTVFAANLKTYTLGRVITIFFLIGIPGLLSVYGYVYGDKKIQYLDTKIEDGIFKGLYTTESNKNLVLQMEKKIKENVNSEDRFCVVTLEPMLYLMSPGSIYTPHTWDPQFLYRGYTSAEPLLSYFETMNEYPDVIAATNSFPKDFFENDNYEIKNIINEQYDLICSDEIDNTKIALWKKK